MTRNDVHKMIREATEALDFGDHVPSETMKGAAYQRAMAYALTALAEIMFNHEVTTQELER